MIFWTEKIQNFNILSQHRPVTGLLKEFYWSFSTSEKTESNQARTIWVYKSLWVYNDRSGQESITFLKPSPWRETKASPSSNPLPWHCFIITSNSPKATHFPPEDVHSTSLRTPIPRRDARTLLSLHRISSLMHPYLDYRNRLHKL